MSQLKNSKLKKIKKIIESKRERDNRASSKDGGRDGAVCMIFESRM